MDGVAGADLRVDEAVLAAALRGLAPLVGEIDAALDEMDAIVGDLRFDCSGHHTGVDFISAQSGLARMTGAQLRAVRDSMVAFTDNLARAAAEFGDVEAATAAELRSGRC